MLENILDRCSMRELMTGSAHDDADKAKHMLEE
jgi:hypothetical protein